MTELFDKEVTIYNDIPSDSVNSRRFERAVLNRCAVQNGYIAQADGTIQNVVNAQTVICKDVGRYVAPSEYTLMPHDLRADKFTVQIGDFVVLGEVDDVVSDAREFAALQQKYKSNGFVVISANAYIHGMAVDNVTMANV